MSQRERVMVLRPESNRGRLMSYVTGFILSMVLTLSAYGLVTHEVLSRTVVVSLIIGLALIQFVVQLIFFLHLSQESRPRWRLMVFLLMALIVAILVFGSLWIMQNLNYHMVSPTQMHQNEGL